MKLKTVIYISNSHSKPISLAFANKNVNRFNINLNYYITKIRLFLIRQQYDWKILKLILALRNCKSLKVREENRVRI